MIKVDLEQPQRTLRVKDLKVEDHIGFVTNSNEKGFFTYGGAEDTQGRKQLQAISSEPFTTICNRSFGALEDNLYTEIPRILKGGSSKIVDMYKFSTRKELFKWLSE